MVVVVVAVVAEVVVDTAESVLVVDKHQHIAVGVPADGIAAAAVVVVAAAAAHEEDLLAEAVVAWAHL